MSFIWSTLLVVVGVFLVWKNVRIVPQTQVYIIERLGKYHKSWEAGLHIKWPIIDAIASKVSLKEQVLDFPPQGVITKDNVTMTIDSIVFLKVMDPKLYTYGVARPIMGVENLTATTLRNIVGDMDFDATLSGREVINTKMATSLDVATDTWGIKITRVELKTIEAPEEIEEVMTKQMKAERVKRQAILEAEAHRESTVMRAEGDKAAMILNAEAERDSRIALAEGEANSIKKIYEAQAEGLKNLSDVKVTDSVLRIKGFEALKDMADGNSTKIFMPTDAMAAISTLGAFSEITGVGQAMAINEKPKAKEAPKLDPCINEDSSEISKKLSEKTEKLQKALKDSRGANTR